LNLCGGCTTLTATPGASCGVCGTVICIGTDVATCIDPCGG
jgi:hypothetical protein